MIWSPNFPLINTTLTLLTFYTLGFFHVLIKFIWARAQQNQQNDLCAQWRLGLACASTKSNQSSLCALRVDKNPNCLRADIENYDQTGRIPSLVWVFAWPTGHFVVVLRLNFSVLPGYGQDSSTCQRDPKMLTYSTKLWSRLSKCTKTVLAKDPIGAVFMTKNFIWDPW